MRLQQVRGMLSGVIGAGVLRRALVIGFLAAALVAVLAEADHAWKNHRMRSTYVDTWFCVQRGERCDRPQATAIEESWQHREVGYRIVFALSLYGTLGAGVVSVARSRARTLA